MTAPTPETAGALSKRQAKRLLPVLPVLPAVCCLLLAACANQPPVPDWQTQSHAAAQRAVQAWLVGQDRIAEQEWHRARQAVARTGAPTPMARLELLACAAHAASLAPVGCPRFAALAQDAPPAEQAYAAYLAGESLSPAQIALLPTHQQGPAQSAAAAPLATIGDPLAQLVAAGVLLRRGQASPATVQTAVETASRQGWRRPLLAWLGVQTRLAEQGGRTEEAARLRRRIQLVEQGGS